MSRARDIANFDPALLTADEVSLDKVNGGTLGTGTIGGSSVINTSGAITTTGAIASATLTTTGNITMGDDTSIGIGDSAERIEFDGAGDISVLGANLGVGTDSPDYHLEVEGTGDQYIAVHSSDNNKAGIHFKRTSGYDATIELDGGHLKFMGNAGGTTEYMRITDSGSVGIGIAAPGDYGSGATDLVIGNHSGNHGLSILSSTSGEGRINFGDNDTTGAYHGSIVYGQADDGYFTFRNADAVRLKFGGSTGKIYYTGMGVLADQVQVGIRASDNQIVKQSSSRRYKENIVNTTVDSSKIHDIVIRDFDWIGEPEVDLTGLIAEEVFEILPECVALDQVNGEGPLVPEAIKYPTLTAILINQVQKMAIRITALENA